MKTFYIETFGCQMNAHDSEKVVGTLVAQGYTQVATPEEAELVLYNTCSIRDKAEQKVFNRLQQFKRSRQGQDLRRAGLRGAAGRREDLRARAARQPGVRLGQLHASCREMLVQLEAGNRRVTGLSLDTDETFETPVHAARQSAPRLHHHHRRLRQELRLLRGAVHARPGAQPHQRQRLAEARRAGAARATPRSSCWARTSNSYRTIHRRQRVGTISRTARAACAEVPGIRRVRFTTSHPRDFVQDIVDAIDDESGALRPRPSAGAVRLHARAGGHAAALHARGVHAAHRVDEAARSATSRITTDIIVGFPGETEADFDETLGLLDEVRVRFDVHLQVLAAAPTRRRCATRITFPRKRRRGG